MNILLASHIGWLSELTYFRFFPVICWSYLRTEISVTLSIVNKLYSRHHQAKLVYYIPSSPFLPGPLWPGVVALDRVLSMD